MLALLAAAAAAPFTAPTFDLHTFAPEIIIVATLAIAVLVDSFVDDSGALVASLTSIGLLAAIIPLITMAATGHDPVAMGGAYMVDNYALVL